MTENVSKHGFDLIKSSSEKLKGKFGKAFIGTLVAFSPLILLMLFVPYYIGFALAIFLFGVIQTGYIRFMRQVMNGENPSLKVIYSEIKTGWLETFVGTVTLIMYLLGGILFIVPGIILYGYFAMSLFVAEKEKITSLTQALKSTKEKMNKNIVSMYAYKLFFWIFYIILIAATLLGYIGIASLIANNLVLGIVVAIVAVLALLIVYAILTAYYHAANEVFFQEVLYYNEKNKSVKKQVKVVKEEELTTPAEPVNVEEKEAPKKAEPKKTTTRKTTTKK